MPRRLQSFWVVVVLLLIGADPLSAQRGVAAAAEQVAAGLPTGTRAYSPGEWGLVEVQVVNRSDRPATVLSTIFFPDGANLQYGREIWLPPRSRRLTSHPVLIPELPPGEEASLAFDSVFIDRTGGTDQVVPTATGQMLNDGILPIDREGRLTGRVQGDSEYSTNDAIDAVNQMVIAARVRAGLSRKIVSLRGVSLPSGSEALQGMEHLILIGNRPLSDAAGMAALRRWVDRGGKLWIVLNEVSPELVAQMLGDVCRVQVVDRVGLTQIQIAGVGPALRSSERERREFEEPVELVRVLTDGLETFHTVNGWPASFGTPVGRGEVLFTALGPKGWVRPRPEGEPPLTDVHGEIHVHTTEPLSYLSERLFSLDTRARPTPPADDWQPFLTEQIGYRIVSRGTVLALLGTFCAVLAAAAVWFGRQRRLERLGIAAPALALVAAGGLAAIGMTNSHSVPSTVAVGELVETSPGSTAVRVSGMQVYYNQQPTAVALGSTGGGVVLPDMSGFAGQTRRMVWTDWNRWHWENLTLPAGVRIAPFQMDQRLEAPVAARGAFGAGGFTGRVTGPFEELGDLVLTTRTFGNLAPRLGEDGSFTAGPGEVLAPGIYIGSTLLNDAQRRRQDFYQRLLHVEHGDGRYRDRPTLLAWTSPLDLGVTVPQDSQRVGAACVVLPVEIERTPPDSQVLIPSPFVRFRAVPRPDGTARSPLYNAETGEWIEYSGDIESWLRFAMPREVLPLRLELAELTLRVNGALERLEVVGLAGDRIETLRAWDDPVGTLQLSIDRADVLALDSQGGLRLGLRLKGTAVSSEAGADDLRQYWQIEAVELQVSGRTPSTNER